MRAVPVIVIALLNSLWQSGILAALVWAALKFARRINAATRYAIWWIVLAVVLVLPLAPRVQRPQVARAHGRRSANSIVDPYLKTPVLVAPDAILTVQDEPSARWPVLILGVWAALLLYRLGQTGKSYLYLRGVKRRARVSTLPLPAVPRSVRLLLSDEIDSPFAVGFVRPAIVLPASLPDELGQTEMDHVLLHEAAHIARWDDWTNLLARLLGAALALHPVVLWILSRIEREREMACDDWAVARIGAARPYAESLAHICELQWAYRKELLATGMLGWGSRIGGRIEMLLRRGREFSPRVSLARVSVSAAVLLALLVAASIAPRGIGLAQRLEFEVASVKLNTTNGTTDFVPRRSGDRVIIHNNQLGGVILYAYNVPFYRVVGEMRLPDGWNWYDIEARAPGTPSDDQIRLMLQALLEDRFKLRVHRETREMAVYKLVIAKNGPKLKPAGAGFRPTVDGRPIRGNGIVAGVMGMDGQHLIGKGAAIAQLVNALSGPLAGPVVDGTGGIEGKFDFDVRFIRDDKPAPDGEPGPDLPASLQEVLGLKLERSKAPIEVLVIDHLEKPSEK
jgi:uncharacterized protein (TIGR03435 family)